MRELSKPEADKYIATLSGEQQASFLNQDEVKAYLIAPGEKLWRFVSQREKHGPRFSPFWIDPHTMDSLMSIFRSWGKHDLYDRKDWDRYDIRTKKDVVRNNLAILYDWNQLNYRLQITLKKEVVGFKGQANFQKYFVDNEEMTKRYKAVAQEAIEYRRGGYTQFVIPQFHGGMSEAEKLSYAEVSHFAHL